MKTTTEQAIGQTAQIVSDLRSELHDGNPAASRAEQLREQLRSLKARQSKLQRIYDSQWSEAHASAPRQVELTKVSIGYGPETVIRVRTEAMGGAKSIQITSRDANFVAAMEEYETHRKMDATIAQIAYEAWGWSGPVKIEYYGDRAIVRAGQRRHSVEIPQS